MAEQLRFVEDFATPTMEEWTSEVEKALKGAPFDKKMLTRTYEGFTLRPVYTRNDWPADGDPSGMPGAMPFTRGSRAAGNRVSSWDVRQRYTYPDPAKCNDIILNELARGVSSLLDPVRQRQPRGHGRGCAREPAITSARTASPSIASMIWTGCSPASIWIWRRCT